MASEPRRVSYFSAQHIQSASGPVISEKDVSGRIVNTLLIRACVAFSCSSFLFGFDNIVISPVAALETFVHKYQGPRADGKFIFSARNQNLLFSLPLVGSVLGAIAAPFLNFRYGRKWPLIASYFLSFGGVLLQLFAPNFGAFVAGRFWNNVVTGIASTTAPLYLAEIVPAEMRGRAVSSLNILTVFAGVVGTVVVFVSHGRADHWSYSIPLLVQAIIPVVLIPLTIFLPESPQWLTSKDQMEEARRNLRKLRGFSDNQVDDELRVMKACEDNERAFDADTNFWQLFNKQNRLRTVAGASMFSMNQASGIILSTTYATVFLVELGVGRPFTLTVIASSCQLAGTIVAPLTLDMAGRRPTALTGMVVLFIIDIIAGAFAFRANVKSYALTIAALGFVFNFFWAASFYSVSSLIPSEIATPKLRNYTMAYTIACCQTTAVITTLAVPQIISADAGNLGAKAYLIFGGAMFFIIIWTYFLIPETKGRTFAEIDELYDRKIPMRNWARAITMTEARRATIISAHLFQP